MEEERDRQIGKWKEMKGRKESKDRRVVARLIGSRNYQLTWNYTERALPVTRVDENLNN